VSVIGLSTVDAANKNKEMNYYYHYYLRDFPLFYVCPTIKNCPSARCASAANVVFRDFGVFRNHNVSLEHILL
jgi:hypothetical protein